MTDTYPIYNGKNKLTFWSVFPYIVIIVLVFLLFKSCGKVEPKPVIITGKQVHDTIVEVDKQAQRIRDSFTLVLNRKYKDDDANYQAYLKLLNDNAVLLNQNEMLSIPVPDTCQKLQDSWIAKFNQVKVASNQKDVAANRTITGLQSTVTTQKKFLASKDTTISKYRTIADTCSKALSQLEAYAKKIKPKRELNAGIEVNSSYINLKPIIGIGIGYRDRRGNQINAAIFSNQTISVGIKKTLFKF
jgi:hypothetical protein